MAAIKINPVFVFMRIAPLNVRTPTIISSDWSLRYFVSYRSGTRPLVRSLALNLRYVIFIKFTTLFHLTEENHIN